MDTFILPEGFSEIKKVNLQQDKKLALIINIGAFVIMVALFILGMAFVPFSFEIGSDNSLSFILGLVGLMVAILVYMLAHELIHGVFIKKYSGKKAKYGFTGLYAYAGSEAYFTKPHYVIIALAPVIVSGILFLLLNLLLPQEWFWYVYFLQIVNLSGAAGDIYMTWLMSRLPEDVLTRDEGVEMTMYSRTK